MLIIEIAAGVFIGGLLLAIYLRAHKARERAGNTRRVEEAIRRALDPHLEGHLKQLLEKKESVFAARLTTLEDDPGTHFATAGMAEMEILNEHLKELEADETKNIVSTLLATELASAERLGIRSEMEQLAKNLVSYRLLDLKNAAMLRMTTKLLEIDETNRKRNAEILAGGGER